MRLTATCSLLLFANLVSAQTFTTIHSFQGKDGSYPLAGLVEDANSVLYGTTESGGTGLGTVYSLAPQAQSGTYTETVLHHFTGVDGQAPSGKLLGVGGALYGTASQGGTKGAGTVFRLTSGAQGQPWVFTVIYNFQAVTDGNGPFSGLVSGPGGVFYGTTTYGGTASCANGQGCGTVFSLTPPAVAGDPWTEAVIYRFQFGTDGNNPSAGLALAGDGALYGTTSGGGSAGAGTIFRLSPPAVPGDPWTESIVYSFNSGLDGELPLAGVSLGNNGKLFGSTSGGGSLGCGTIFQLVPGAVAGQPWTKYTIHQFKCSDGAYPEGALLVKMGYLYGTTSGGGTSGGGTIFSLKAPAVVGSGWALTTMVELQANPDGSNPVSGLLDGAQGALLGTAMSGGVNGLGTVFQLIP